jgi:hypothetical protein
MNVGPPRLDIQPLTSEGNVGPNIRGNHRGPAAGLNVHNPQAGMHYYHVRHPNADRSAAMYRTFYNQGWRPVGPNDPEYTSEEQDLDLSKLGIEDMNLHKDTLLMRIPEEQYRKLEAYNQANRDAQIEGPTHEFLSKSREFENSYGATADGPMFYRGPGHGSHTS